MQRGSVLRRLPGAELDIVVAMPRAAQDDIATINADGTLYYKRAQGDWGVFRTGENQPFAVLWSACAPTFSRSDPSVLYLVGGRRNHTLQAAIIDRQSFVVSRFVTQFDIDDLGLGLLTEQQVGGLGMANTGLLAYFGGVTPTKHTHVLLILEAETAPCFLLDTVSALGTTIKRATVDLSGYYVVIEPSTGSTDVVWDVRQGLFVPVTDVDIMAPQPTED